MISCVGYPVGGCAALAALIDAPAHDREQEDTDANPNSTPALARHRSPSHSQRRWCPKAAERAEFATTHVGQSSESVQATGTELVDEDAAANVPEELIDPDY